MKLDKAIFNYFLLSIAAFIFDKVYALFGHGVTSPWMTNMFLYLLGLGSAVFLLLKILTPDIASLKGYRLFYNTYNSGIAILINGMLIQGILEIAGGTSQIVPWFFYIGYGLIAASAIMFCMILNPKARMLFSRQ